MPKLTADTITLRMADLFVMLPAEKRGEALGMLRGIEYAQRKTVAPEAPAAEQAELLSDGIPEPVVTQSVHEAEQVPV